MRIEIYADGCDLATMATLAPRVAGFTTNPSLMKKAGIRDYAAFARTVLGVAGGKPVSFEVLADDLETMARQARTIAEWGENVLVKIPVSTTRGEFTGPLIATLTDAGVKVNVTAVLSYAQAQHAWECIGKPGSIISIFAGRIADTGIDPVNVIRPFAEIARRNGTRVLWASARQAFDAVRAQDAGADIITLAPELIGKLAAFGRDLGEYSLETVRQFAKDAEGIAL